MSRQDGAYHIIQDGIITRKDYSLLFENDDERRQIPVEVSSQLNVYGNVTITPEALTTICQNGIRVSYVDKFGDLMGTFTPEGHAKSASVFLKQAQLYGDAAKRLELAKRLEIAGAHNMRANLRYYARRGISGLDTCISYISGCISEMNEEKDVNALMLIEARAHKSYYASFANILVGKHFDFSVRTRRPPKDRGNAMVSFGNAVLYNYILQCIWRTSLDPKIGIVHATNRRSHSLNLDTADLFKPVVVDRVIFSLVNRHEMDYESHFVEQNGGGVLLSRDGKRVFIERCWRRT